VAGLEDCLLIQDFSVSTARYAQMIMDSIKRDGFFIRVPASKLFYLFVRWDIDTAQATVAG
jgi:hypothetical protein